MASHGRALLRIAFRWSLCHDDAMDAYQRALEIFLRRIDSVAPDTEVAWLKVVVKHEALAIRRSRTATLGSSDVDPDQELASAERPVEEKVASDERVSRSAEALRALKPDEARALLLKAEGLSYVEIAERCGWTYTKVNRAITEGRRRFMEVFRAIESGDACDRYAGILAALAGGHATSAEILEVRPHLRHCIACRATVRELHMTKLAELQLWVPAVMVAPLSRLSPAPTPDLSSIDPADLERAITVDGHAAVPLDHVETATRVPRLGHLRDQLLSWLSRGNSSDVATGIHILATGGSGRITTIATAIGFCLSSVGAGALCVATGVVEAPRWFHHHEARPAPPHHEAKKPTKPRRTGHSEVTRTPRVTELLRTSTPTPTATPAPVRRASRRSSSTTAHTPGRDAASVQAAEFGFESTPTTGSPTSGPTPVARTLSSKQVPPPTTSDAAQKEFGP